VDIMLEESPATSTLVPREAVFTDSAAGQPSSYVYVRAADGQWARRNIVVALQSNTRAVVASGVKPGDTVALEPPPKPESHVART
jgi:multidrug efflux pump subunit AcrA (membrane-fusion protein)